MVRQRSSRSHSPKASEKSRYDSLSRQPNGDRAQFAETVASSLGMALDAIINEGDAVMISRTSDGGAISLCIYSDAGKPTKLYAVVQAELDDYVGKLADGT